LAAFEKFARVYDLFMEEVPYEEWVDYIERIFEMNQLSVKTLLDLGCGTGTMSVLFAQKNYEVIGIDLSEDMLSVAKEKSIAKELDILYLNQDMTEFELYGTVDAIISVCDSLNYILKEDDLLKTFELVNNYLNADGLFIFDLNTEFKFRDSLSDNTFATTFESEAYVWENFYDAEEKTNVYCVNFFEKQKDSELYERFEEVHYQRCYSTEEVVGLLTKSGLKILNIYKAFTFEKADDKSERVYFVARKDSK